jgi:hypothetical protein
MNKVWLSIVLFSFLFRGTPPGGIHFGNEPDAGMQVAFFNVTGNIRTESFIADNNTESMVIPLKRAGNLILIEAIIDSIPGNLILDSGSGALLLNSMYFRKGRTSGELIAGGVTGSTGTVSRIRVNQLQISEMIFSNVEADVTDLGHLESARNIRVLGLIGLELFGDMETVIDLQNNVMELHRLNFRGNRMSQNPFHVRPDIRVPIRIESGVVFVDAMVGSRRLTFCLDTGSEINALGNHLPNQVLGSLNIIRRASIRGVGARQVEVIYAEMNDFSISNVKLEGMNTIITNLSSMSHSYGLRIDGMLGCDFIEKGIIYINPRKRQMDIVLYKNGEEQP